MTSWGSRGSALTAVVALLATGCGEPASSAPEPTAGTVVRIAAASDLRFALEEVAELVASEHPGIELAVTYGSSGQFVQQIGNGAPFDLYLSADLAYPQQLVDEGLAESGDVFSYGVGRLVVWAAEESPVDPGEGLAVLADPAVRTVAIANPDHAPYGRAAVEALRAAGVWDVVEPKLVLGENVSQASDFVRSGNADAGVVALSLALAPSAGADGRWAEVPLELFSPLEQGGVVLAGARDLAATRAVRYVLLGEEGRAVLASYGFLPAD
ncbi:MAG TPA: molybdate ABC transporter substrate-binding protein [Jiangellales bacterium]|nr:molybdate ABC transporter substrate-binding protein [Jiangellales bacterium]